MGDIRHKIFDGQSLLDVALQRSGSLEQLIALAVINDLAISDDLIAGTYLDLVGVDVAEPDVVYFFTRNNEVPATANSLFIGGEPVEILEGISIWAIGIDFIVS